MMVKAMNSIVIENKGGVIVREVDRQELSG